MTQALNTKEWFNLPNMRLNRDDLKDFTDRDFTDDEMQEIADKLSKALMQTWYDDIQTIIRESGQ